MIGLTWMKNSQKPEGDHATLWVDRAIFSFTGEDDSTKKEPADLITSMPGVMQNILPTDLIKMFPVMVLPLAFASF